MNDYHKLVSRMQRITMSVSSLTSGLFWALWSMTPTPTLHFPNYTMIHLFRNVQKKFSNLRPTFRHRFIILMSKLFSKELESYVNKINHSSLNLHIFVDPITTDVISQNFRNFTNFHSLTSKVFCFSIFYNPSESNFVSVQFTRV